MNDMLDALGAEYVGSILPYDTQILHNTQDGVLIQDIPKAYRHMLAPVVEYITSGDAWVEQDLIERFNEVTSVKVTEPYVTATLAQPVESDDDNS
ncbi:cobalamin biosynthesis protein CobQ, partial [Veillonella atypica]|nr:cobalamin biosynthesis protein CobQ [Veillonella atypica]